MPTFRQRHTITEDFFRPYTITFVMSDTYEGLFATEDVQMTDVFVLEGTSFDYDLASGALAQDELRLNVDESAAETEDDLDAIAFFKAVQDPANPRYCAVFVDTPDLPSAPLTADLLFAGRVATDIKGTDLQHQGAAYSPAINAVREWQARAANFMDEVVDKIPLSDLIYGNIDNGVVGILNTWENANVADRLGWYKSTGGDPYGAREARFMDLVSLSALLRRLADNVEETLANQGIGTYNIYFDDVTFDWAASPARFRLSNYTKTWKPRHLTSRSGPPMIIKADDMHPVGLGDTLSEEEQIWVHYRMVKPVGKAEKDLSFLRCKSFTELLYGLASSFGVLLRFEQPNSTDIHVKFVPRRNDERPEVFFREAQEADIDIGLADNEDSGAARLYGKSCEHAIDGHDTYVIDDGMRFASPATTKNAPGEMALVTVSPTLVQFPMAEDAGYYTQWGHLPQNSIFTLGSSREDANARPDKGVIGLHTGIYIRIESSLPGATYQWAPVAMVHATVEGQEMHFTSLTDYVNMLRGRDQSFFRAEYNLTVPYFNAFHNGGDVPTVSWKALQLGSVINIEENSVPREFVVVGIERNLAYPETRIRLHRSSRLAFTEPADITADANPVWTSASSDESVTPDTSTTTVYIAGEDIAQGDAVSDATDGEQLTVVRTRPVLAHYGRIVGIATHGADEGDSVAVQGPPKANNEAWQWVPGKRVYVRNAELPNINLTQQPFQGVSGGMVATLGVADSPTTLLLDLSDQKVYE
jgi:hypothetical protein